MSDIEPIIDRHSRRPGYVLLSYREVALPYWKVPLRCRVLRRKPIPAIDEFVLRAISAGLRTDVEVASFLGLSSRVVETTMGSLVSAGHLTPTPIEMDDSVGFGLTVRGKAAVSQLIEEVPEERTLELAFDGLTRQFTIVEQSERWRPRDLQKAGLLEISAFPPDPPDIGPDDTEAVAETMRDVLTQSDCELLAVLGLADRREKFFVRAIAMVFQPVGQPADATVAFLVDGRSSPSHDEAFAAAEGRRKLGLLTNLHQSGLPATQREVSSELLADLPRPEEVANLRRITSVLRDRHARVLSSTGPDEGSDAADPTEAEDVATQLEEAETILDLLPVRILEVHEHPGYLRDGLDQARDRLLIVSPWIRAKVVDQTFRAHLERLLKDGVQVCIAHGIDDGTNAPDWDKRAEEALEELAAVYPNFVMKRLGDTHAKILVVDDRFVIVTSFNWLSYKGDPNLPFRDERGTLVTVKSEIDRIYEDYLGRAQGK
ncbi:phospholipase D-like domain-containing protein [Nocardioides sp. WV_118_6]